MASWQVFKAGIWITWIPRRGWSWMENTWGYCSGDFHPWWRLENLHWTWWIFNDFHTELHWKRADFQLQYLRVPEGISWGIRPTIVTIMGYYVGTNRRKFRSQTSDNMDRWKAEQGRGREKRKIRRKKSRRERVRRKKMQMREKVGRSRNTVFFQWFGAPEGRKVGSLKRRVRSQLARWEMKNCTPLWREAHFQVKMCKTPQLRSTFRSCDVEKVHAIVARSTFPSQNVQKTPLSDHFWKLRCWKSARRCGAKAHFQVKMYKTHQVRATFCSWDFEKVYAAVARSTFWSQNVQNTPSFGPLLEVQMSEKVHAVVARSTFRSQNVQNTTCSRHFWKFGCRFASLHYTTFHYTTLHYTILHYTTLHYLPLHLTTLHYTPLHYNYNYTTTLHYTPLHSTTLNYTTLHYIALHYAPLHYTTLHYTTFHYTSLHYTTLHSTTLQLQLRLHNYTPLHSITLHYTTLHYTTLHYIPLHSTTLHYIALHSTTLHYIALHYNILNDTAPQIDR